MQKFGVGQPVPRTEDPKLVRGEGRYTDDLSLPGQAYAAIVRSSHAHGVLKGIDTSAARAMPGVLAIYTGADLQAAGYGGLKCVPPFKNRDGTPMKKPLRPALAVDKVRFVGDPVACVIAETAIQAKEAAEAVVLDIEPLPAVTKASEAMKPGAPQLFDDVPDNVALDYHFGDAEKVKEAFAKAAHVTRLELLNNRLVVNAMEPRAAIASYDREERALHLPRRMPGRVRPARPARRDPQYSAGQAAPAHRQCRRLLRHEGAGLSRIHPHAARRAPARAAGQVDRRALDELPLRQPRPRPREGRRARARQPTAASSRCGSPAPATWAPISARWRRCRRRSTRSRTWSASTARR